MARAAHLDIIGGISGDMFLATLIDAGLPIDALDAELRKALPTGWALQATGAQRGAVRGTHVAVILDEPDQRWNWSDFARAIDQSNLPDADRSRAAQVFDALRTAESEAHDGDASHLHELGTADTLIDVVGVVCGLSLLDITRLHASPLPISIGVARSSHGVTASIAPATMALIRQHRLPIASTRATSAPIGEAVTPTGAALLAVLAETDNPIQMRVTDIGYGVGTRESADPPNVLGIWLGDAPSPQHAPPSADLAEDADALEMDHESDKWLLETNLDDATGETLGYAMTRLFDAGALDVWTTPILMKKSRPATTLSAIVQRDRLREVARTLMTETPTFGIRCTPLQRLVARRQVVRTAINGIEVRAKVRHNHHGPPLIAPEYDDCAALARLHGVPLSQVMRDVTDRVRQQLTDADDA